MTLKNIDIALSSKQVGNTRVYLWIGKCDSSSKQIFQMKALLSPGELKRAGAFHFTNDSLRYICAHATLRVILSQYCGVPPHKLDFMSNSNGKPFLNNHPEIRFNLSHTQDIIAIAVTFGHDVGVDIEKYVSIDTMNDLSKKIMTGTEYRQFMNSTPDEQTLFFYKCWVRKEAVVKAWGKGIDDNLCDIAVMEDGINSTQKIISIHDRDDPKTWRVQDIDLDCQCTGAVCVEGDSFELKLEDLYSIKW